jgi:hypothetical protein
MRLYEIIGHPCGTGIHYDPTKKTIRTNTKVRAKITLRGLRKMNLLKKRQQKLDNQKSMFLGVMYGTGSGSTESDLSIAADELKTQSRIDKLAMSYVKKSF